MNPPDIKGKEYIRQIIDLNIIGVVKCQKRQKQWSVNTMKSKKEKLLESENSVQGAAPEFS